MDWAWKSDKKERYDEQENKDSLILFLLFFTSLIKFPRQSVERCQPINKSSGATWVISGATFMEYFVEHYNMIKNKWIST